MRRYKIIPRVLLILSIINFALAAPVPVPERGDLLVLEKPRDKYLYERWRKRGSSSESASSPWIAPSGAGAGEPADDQTLMPTPDTPPPSPQTGMSEIQQQTSPSSSGIKRPSPSEEQGYLSSGEDYQASNEGGPGSSEGGYSSSGSNTPLLAGSGSTSKGYSSATKPSEVGPGVSLSHSTSNLPLLSGSVASKGHLTPWNAPANMPVPPVQWLNPQPQPQPRPKPAPAPDRNNPFYWGASSSTSTPPELDALDVAPKKNFISGFFSNAKVLLSTLFSKSKDFLSMLLGKLRFWRRTSES